MKKGGCEIISFGLESGVQRLLNTIRKQVTLEKMREAIHLGKQAGLDVRGSFILGLPTETFIDSLKTIKFGLSLPLDRVKFGLATPYPGTELWETALNEGQISEQEEWDRFSQMAGYTKHKAPYIPKGRRSLELKLSQLVANLLFYLKPHIIVKIIKRYFSFGGVKELFSHFFSFIKATIFPAKK